MDQAAFCSVGGEVHSGEEELSGQSTQPSRPGSSHGLVPFATGVRGDSQVGRLHLDLFATRVNTKLPLVSPVPDPLTWKEGALHQPWDNLFAYAFPSFVLFRQVLSRVLASKGLSLVLVAPLWPQKEWFAYLLFLLMANPLNFHEFGTC